MEKLSFEILEWNRAGESEDDDDDDELVRER